MAVQQINFGHDGSFARQNSMMSVTATGRWQVLTGFGDDLLGLSGSTVFIRDSVTGVIEAAAFTATGDMVESAYQAFISADGRYVTYTSGQDNIVLGDTNRVDDVFRYDRVTKTTVLVTRADDGAFANGGSFVNEVSADGRYIAFVSKATNLDGATGTVELDYYHQYVRDMQTGDTRRLTMSIDATKPYDGPPVDPQTAWAAFSITNAGGVSWQYHQYFDGEWGYSRDGGQTLDFNGEITRYPGYDVQTNAAGTETVTWAGRFSLEFVVTLPGDDKPVKYAVNGQPWIGASFIHFAENGRFVAMATQINPATGAFDPGVYVLDLYDRSQTKVGTFVKVADLETLTDFGWLEISADGSFISYSYYIRGGYTPGEDPYDSDVAPYAHVFRADNPLGSHGGGTVEIARPTQWLITESTDTAVGTSTHDEIRLKGGHDRAFGAAGDDRIWGDDGNDRIEGNIGSDTLYGGDGEDKLFGDQGSDWLYGGADKDTLDGGEGVDRLYGEGGDDKLDGDAGNDELFGGADNDVLRGGSGNDTLDGGTGNDLLLGGEGNEVFAAGIGDDVIDGGEDGDGKDIDVLQLIGSAADYSFYDEFREVDGEVIAVTTVRSDPTGFDTVANVEEARFDSLRANVATVANTYLTLAIAADTAYHSAQRVGNGWHALSALELGIDRGGVIADPASETVWTYSNGAYSAIGPGRINDDPVEAAAQVYFGVVDGKTTLMVAIRGTDSLSDTQDYPQFAWHYDRFKPLVDAVLKYVANDGYAATGQIDQVWIAGHSLGGATVQQMMQDPRIAGDPRFLAATFGSPGSEDFAYDPRIVHFEHTADVVPLAGDVARNVSLTTSLALDWLVAQGAGPAFEAFLQDIDNPTHFRTAGDVVRLTTPAQVGGDPGAQHSMTNYVTSLQLMAQHAEKFPVMTQGTAGIPGAPGTIEVAIGTDAADTMVGAWGWVVRSLRGESYWNGAERFVGGRGFDTITGGSGTDRFEGSLLELNGDTITDFGSGESFRVWGGAPIQQVQVGYRFDEDAGRGVLTVAGAEIYLNGRHSGSFTVTQQAGYSEITFTGTVSLLGSAGDDEIEGGDGNDTVTGLGGNDYLLGGDGSDTLNGDAKPAAGARTLGAAATDGDDVLDGGKGADTLTGGGGRDTFVLGTDAADTITDFQGGYDGDTLDVTAIVVALGVEADPFLTGHLRLERDGSGGTRLIMDTDGGEGGGTGTVVAILQGIAPDALGAENFVSKVVAVDPANGLPAIYGSDERDYLAGSDEAERIIGNGGADVIFGGGGRDRIFTAGPEYGHQPTTGPVQGTIPEEFADYTIDIAFGGDGDDMLVNHALYAEMHGGDGEDMLTGSYGHHLLFGDAGDDRFLLTQGYYTLWGGTGADRYIMDRPGSAAVQDFDVAADRIDVSLYGITAFEQVRFESRTGGLSVEGLYLKGIRADQLTVANFIFAKGYDRDIVRAGTDAVVSSPRPDLEKNELFRLDAIGVTEVNGGGGADHFYFGSFYAGSIKIDGGWGGDTLMLQGDYTGARSVRLLDGNFDGIREISLLTAGDARFGRAGGSAAYHFVIGEAAGGFETLVIDGGMLGAGERVSIDAANAMATFIRVLGGDAADHMKGSDGYEEFGGGGGDDRLYGFGGKDLLWGDDGHDIIEGGDGDDALSGGLGHDTLRGGAGNDSLSGGEQVDGVQLESIRDDLYGDAGNDVLYGSSGASLSGGADADRFVFDRSVRDATVEDFTLGAGGDTLDLRPLASDMAEPWEVVDVIREGRVRLIQQGDDVLVQANIDGWLTVATVKNVQLSALGPANVLGVSLPGVTVIGDDDRHSYAGTDRSDTLSGGNGHDIFLLQDGGHDHASGGAGSDGFVFGAALDPLDVVDGGAGADDQVGIRGDYAARQHVLGAGNLIGIETLVLMSGADTRFGGNAGDRFDYNLRTVDANVAAGGRLVVNLAALEAEEDVVFDGSSESDGAFLFYGGAGNDRLTGGAGSDGFYFGIGRFGSGDIVVGGSDGEDQLGLQGNYTLAFGANQLSGIETIVVMGAGDTRFSRDGTAYSYDLTLHDDNALSATLTINGNTLGGQERLRLDGSAETDSMLRIYGGEGGDTLIGGAQADVLFGGRGADTLTGGAGADRFVYLAAHDSLAGEYDRIVDFDAAQDVIDLVGAASAYHRDGGATVTSASAATLGSALTQALDGILTAGGVSLVRATGGALAGNVFVVVDQNGVDGFQADGDLVIDVGSGSHLPDAGLAFIV